MQKKLIALAAAAAIAAPAAAMAEVQVYGKIKASYDVVDRGAAGDVDQISSNRTSRLGFKGSEDLGGGLSAVWQLESAVMPDERAGALSNRNSFVGLSAKDMGTVVLGNHDTPYKMATRSMDVFKDTLADNRVITSMGHDARARNVVAYLTPNFQGFSAAIAYVSNLNSTANVSDLTTNQTATSLMAKYAANGFTGAFAYQNAEDDTVVDLEAWKIGLSYSAMGFTGSFVYADTDNNGAEADAWNLGLKYGFTKADAVKFAYGEQDNGGPDAELWAIGYDHKLSKQTKIYALYADLENGGDFRTVENTANAAPAETDGFSFGIEHKF